MTKAPQGRGVRSGVDFHFLAGAGISTEHNATPPRTPTFISASRTVDWWAVHEFVQPFLDSVGTWPTVGTLEWCALPKNDMRRWAAMLDAAQHHALRIDTAQAAMAEAGHAISATTDWAEVGRRARDRGEFHAKNTWAARRPA